MNLPRLLLTTAFAGCAYCLPASAAPLAYVSNEGSASVSVVDTATDKVVATLKIGEKPRGIALSADGARLYLSDQTLNSLLVVDTAKGVEIANRIDWRIIDTHLQRQCPAGDIVRSFRITIRQ